MKAQKTLWRGKGQMLKVILLLVMVLAVTTASRADLVFDSGYNIFDDSYPYYDEVWVINDAHLDVLGGATWKLELTDHATTNIYDGDIEWLFMKDNTSVNIYAAGDTLEMFAAGNESLAYLHAYDVTYHPPGGLDEGWIEGKYFRNDEPFEFSFYTVKSYSHINVVPEPATVFLIGLGFLILRKRKSIRKVIKMKAQNFHWRGEGQVFKVILPALLIILVPSAVFAIPNWDIYSDAVIKDGDVYNIVRVFDSPPEHTTVDMTGGWVDWLATYDESTLNVTGGEGDFGACDYSVINISGGNHSGGADAYNYGTVNFSGIATSTLLSAYDFGTVNMSGGIVECVGSLNSGIVNVFAGEITDLLTAYDSSIINLYAYDFSYDPTGGAYDDGNITGYWLTDDTPFSINLYRTETYSHINVVPEPATIFLFGFGFLILRKRLS